MKDQAFNEKESISVINFLTEFKRACDSLRIRKGAAVWHLRESMNGSALAAIIMKLTLFSNDANSHEVTFPSYTGMVNHL